MQRELFERDHPELKLLTQGDENKELLLWAHNKKFIRLERFGRRFYYNENHLKDAKMWFEKIN